MRGGRKERPVRSERRVCHSSLWVQPRDKSHPHFSASHPCCLLDMGILGAVVFQVAVITMTINQADRRPSFHSHTQTSPVWEKEVAKERLAEKAEGPMRGLSPPAEPKAGGMPSAQLVLNATLLWETNESDLWLSSWTSDLSKKWLVENPGG